LGPDSNMVNASRGFFRTLWGFDRVDFVLIYCKGMGSQGTKGLIKGGFWHTSEFGSAEFHGQTAKMPKLASRGG
jgi:hypothetical protein